MHEPQDDVGSEGAESDDDEVNRGLFKNAKFFLHESIRKKFSRRNLTRDIEVRNEPLKLDLTHLVIEPFRL